MMKLPLAAVLLTLGTVLPAQGQVLIRVLQGNTINAVANGGTVGVNATGVNQPRDFNVTITYVGAGSLVFPLSPLLLGSQDFTIAAASLGANATLNPGQSVTLPFRYQPTSSQPSSAELNYDFVETTGPQQTRRGLVVIGFNGTVPDYALNYSLAIDANVVNLPAGATLPFIDTPVNGTTVASMIVLNRGSGTGQLQSVTVTGEAFSLLSLPLVPVFIQSGGNIQFQLRYRPRQPGTDTGRLTLTFEGGVTYAVNLTGQGIASYLSYEVLPPEGAAVAVSPNQTAAPILLPATAAGQRSTVFVRLRNSSALDISVSGIAVTGAAFQLSDLPFLPLTMAPGDVQVFSLTFAPTQPGRQTGRLRVGGDTFELAADAIGPILSYSYRTPAGVTGVQPLGGVIFPGVNIGQSTAVEFSIRNTGTAPAPVVNIGIVSDGKTVFTLSGLPPLPTAIAPNTSLVFTIQFTPSNAGPAAASLRINTDAFTLSSIAQTPPTLPDYTLQGPTTVQAFEQPAVGLTLAAPYSSPISGTLTLSTDSDTFVADPSVLFVTGGKSATFTIPAGGTRAVFSNGSTELKFQTGSAAGSIVVTPSFSSGGVDLTPANGRQLRITLPGSAPKLFTLSVDGRTANSVTLQVAGVTTTRSLTKLAVSFKGKPGFKFGQTEFAYDLTANSLLWFNSPASTPYGGQFVAQIPFALNTSGTDAPIQAIESVTVTLSNDRGVSNALTTLIQ